MSYKSTITSEVFETDDYVAEYRLKQGDTAEVAVEREAEFAAIHKLYQQLLVDLKNKGFLDGDTLEGFGGLSVFKQHKPKDSSIFYSIPEFSEVYYDLVYSDKVDVNRGRFFDFAEHGQKLKQLGGQIPDFHLFSFNVTKGLVYNLPISSAGDFSTRIKKAGGADFIFTKENGEQVTISATQGVDPTIAVDILEEIISAVERELESLELTATRNKAIKFLAIKSYMKKKLFYIPVKEYDFKSDLKREKQNRSPVTAYLLELLETDVDLYLMLAAICIPVNKKARPNKDGVIMPLLSVDEVLNLNGVPQHLVFELILPDKDLSGLADWEKDLLGL